MSEIVVMDVRRKALNTILACSLIGSAVLAILTYSLTHNVLSLGSQCQAFLGQK